MMFKDELRKFVHENPKLVSMREVDGGLYVLKYKRSVFFDDLWNAFLEECRGTIVDKEFNVVSRPFTKIYNFGIESTAPKLADNIQVTAYRKVNGFMLAITWHEGQVLVSTTGSIDSPYVSMARELFDEAHYSNVLRKLQDYTLLFECVHRDDPHIIPEKEGLYLLGMREKTWEGKLLHDSDRMQEIANELGCFTVESFRTTVGELLQKVKQVRHEGFVLYTDDGVSTKIKSPFYLVNKWVARNPRTDKLMTDGFKRQLDEEYYPLLSAIRENIAEYTAMDEQSRLSWVRHFLA